ncbi:MAG TPA: galactokinase [Puia sp.]|nr:galactokinase [Puia sp.]
MVSKIRREFHQRFEKEALVAAAPGRVNLIGEHTDYNEGFVLPGAIDKKIYVAIAKNDRQTLNFYATQYQQEFSCALQDIRPVQGWPTYLLGMAYQLSQMGHAITGMDVLIEGDIPIGAGMSSSAAICSAFGVAMNELFTLGLSRMSIALTGQKTEHDFAGLQCGIMDQFASMHGKAGHLMKLDCRSLAYEYIPFHFPDYKIVLVNTMVSHSLAGSEYNLRREQCEEGVAVLRKIFPSTHSLRDASLEQLARCREQMPEIVYRRCHFIVDENSRLLQGCVSLAKGDLASFGQNMFLAHDGLSKLYEVSCKESDFLVAHARTLKGNVGSRQMGGGFGGCTINIVQDDFVDEFVLSMRTAYEKQFNIVPEYYVMQIEDGAKLMR